MLKQIWGDEQELSLLLGACISLIVLVVSLISAKIKMVTLWKRPYLAVGSP
jgi:hypothetical protein